MTNHAALKRQIESELAALLPDQSVIAAPLVDGMRYAVLGGGKRLRPLMVCAACEALGGELERAFPAACAVEFVHNYSLVHDDLPAMDDDDTRHGQPSTHVQFGEAHAILIGDALLTLAFETLAGMDLEPAARVAAIHTLGNAAGWQGMVGGQSFDMQLTGAAHAELSMSKLQALHAAKSGALIRASVEIGAIVAGAKEEQLVVLREFADRVGLAFQITDDVLDETGDTATLGKPAGSDTAQGKSTFLALMGAEQARGQSEELLREALQLLSRIEPQTPLLAELAERAVKREF